MRLPIYEVVIGLEVHAELKTNTKIFCSCPTTFGAPPNTQCCPICLGLPGVMPMLNRRVTELAVKAGLALGCRIAAESRMDRKQYFYPDLPKAYQISQESEPICRGGFLEIEVAGKRRSIGISRIHIEEDAGKLLHSADETLIDCNRCGVPLIEIVSAPDLHSGAEAAAYLKALRAILVAADISDCRMEEGSFRCDVNISVHKKGSGLLGIRSEIKNLNSFAFAEKAIEYEVKRQSELLDRGEVLRNETRRWDAAIGKTVLMRMKERAVDYRYLPEADLAPVRVSPELIARMRAELPELPAEKAERLTKTYSLAASEAEILCADSALADYYEEAAGFTAYPRTLVNLVLTDLLHLCATDAFSSPVSPCRLGALADLLGSGTVNSSTAKKLLKRMTQADLDPKAVVEAEGLAQIRDRELLRSLVVTILQSNPRAVSDYKNGKTAALRALQGKLMAMTDGRADPLIAESLLRAMLNGAMEEGSSYV